MARPKGLISKPPKKPRRNFPLFAHQGGSWCATIDGRRKSFGGWRNDPRGEAAFLRWKEYDSALREGRQAQPVRTGPVTVRDVINSLLEDRLAKMERGELDPGSYADYREATRSFMSIVGPDRSPYELMPATFAAVKEQWGQTRGAAALGRWVQLVRTAFRHAGPDGIGLMDRPPRYGGQFAKPAAKFRRRDIREAEAESGKRLFSPDEIRRILAECNPTLKACVLLGLNCGFLAIDCARLTPKDLDLDRAWLEFVRQKTETPRAAVLWPETVQAIRDVKRPDPKDAADAERIFLTREGRPLVHDHITRNADGGIKTIHRCDAINQSLRDVLQRLGIKRKGVNFSACRKTFRTAADEIGDSNAVNLIMGHGFPGMAQFYVRAVAEPRLKRIADHVHAVLFKAHKGSARKVSSQAAPKRAAHRAAAGEGRSAPRRHARGSGADPRSRSSRKAASRKGKAAAQSRPSS